MKKRIIWVVIIIGIIIGLYIILNGEKVEYSELRDGPHLRGNPEASILLVEFSDFQCPSCAAASSYLKDVLVKYDDKIRFEYRHFPLTSIHNNAFKAAEASECGADQDKFWEYHDILFLNQNSLSKKDLQLYAESVEGLDVELWQDCMKSHAKFNRVREDLDEAQKSGFESTPTFILNGTKVDDWHQLDNLIQELLEPALPLQIESSAEDNKQ